MNILELKRKVCQEIDKNSEKIIGLAKQVAQHPEMGYKEQKTSRAVKDFFKEIELKYQDNLAITGVKAKLKEASSGPNVAVLGELDAVLCPDSPFADPATGAAHACGHHLQLGAMLGAALGLKLSGIGDQLAGNVTFMAVPAEEYVEIAYRMKLREEGKIHYLGGKQELIYRGVFDDIDMAMMIHSQKESPEPAVIMGDSSNGFIGKTIQYLGKEAHAAEAPSEGINALNAAMLGLMGVHALRETFRDNDIVRVHPIITKGGDLVNSVPADVRMETYVRAKTMNAIDATHIKVDRALRAGGDAVGAKTIIKTLPGYLPLDCPKAFNDLFLANASQFVTPENIKHAGHFGGSTDMGDVSHIIPTIHPYIGGVIGALHTRDFKVADYNAACVLPAKLMAMTVIDLLADNAAHANSILKAFQPVMTKEEYIKKLDGYFAEE
ncbi:N-acetylcysteine deacetylase [Sporomusa rhizae]|uniref:amidohydrolase n=1 Tax=Sporomusa rhizae TaxID=357999 RepID=UPI00352AC50B